MTEANPTIAVLIPCHDEEAAIGKVIDDFRAQLPEASLVVFDNNSTDRTAEIAAARGVRVYREPRQGKGFVVEAMFDKVQADLYVMVDGDDTYPAECVHELLDPVRNGSADMAVGARRAEGSQQAFRAMHVAGNSLVRRLINMIFHSKFTDILSGYRAFNRRFACTVPVVSAGFEIETELTVQALYHRLMVVEVPVPYRARPEGGRSKLRTFRDGARVLWKIFSLFRALKPLTFFGGIALVLLAAGILAGLPPIVDYFREPQHYVRHVPLAILATGLVLLSASFAFLGLTLHAINWRFKELHSVLSRGKS
ncbi:MAG: glycosyltransferase [Phycisphaerae bacterium]|nr:glycosyltransferase [Phycisphaerae bacterium]